MRLPYTSRLVRGSKRHEMRSRSMAYFKVSPGEWVWFATPKGAQEGCTGCAVLGGAYFVGEVGPLKPGVPPDEAHWMELAHTVPESLLSFARSMPPGYMNGVWGWEFEGAIELQSPVDMADDPNMTMARFAARGS